MFAVAEIIATAIPKQKASPALRHRGGSFLLVGSVRACRDVVQLVRDAIYKLLCHDLAHVSLFLHLQAL